MGSIPTFYTATYFLTVADKQIRKNPSFIQQENLFCKMGSKRLQDVSTVNVVSNGSMELLNQNTLASLRIFNDEIQFSGAL